MEWLALLVGLLGGGTIGAVGTAVLTVSHERTERFRDRQFEAASRFTTDYEATLDAVIDLWEAVTNIADAQQRVREAAEPAHQALKEAVGIDDVLGELNKAINVGLDLIGRHPSSERATEEIARSRAVIEDAIETLSGRMEEPFASTHRELLRSMQVVSDALARLLESTANLRTTLYRLLMRVAQLNLLFAGEDAEVVEAGRQVTEALISLARAVLNLPMDDLQKFEEESSGITDEIQDVNQLLADFAALVSTRVRPRSLVRDLVG